MEPRLTTDSQVSFLNWEEPLSVWRREIVSDGVSMPFNMSLFTYVSITVFLFFPFISDQALPGFSGGGRPSGRGADGDGRDPVVCPDRQAATKADVERQVTQRSPDSFIGPQKIGVVKYDTQMNQEHWLVFRNESKPSELRHSTIVVFQ